MMLTFGEHARALAHNGAGQYEAALPDAESASAQDELAVSVWSLPELVEAAARCGKDQLAGDALERLSERTRAAGTEWALGIEARSRALIASEPAAEDLHLEAIDRLCRGRSRRNRPAPIFSMANGFAVKPGASTHASNSERHTRCSRKSAWTHSRSALAESSKPPARRSANADRDPR